MPFISFIEKIKKIEFLIMSTQYKRIAFHTLGCKLNFSETATISRDFIRHGFEKVDYRDKADFYVLNTCSVTDNANKEARKLIRQAKRRNPDSSVAVIGCYAQLKPNEISEIDGVDIVLGAEEKFNLLDHLDAIDLKGKVKVIQSEIDHVHTFIPSYSTGERTRSFLKIQDGCDYSCSFCTVPLARGENRSDSIANTMKKARELAETNTKEIVLTGVNIGDFGKGSKETFYALIQQLDTLERIDRVRISSIEPNLLTNKIIEFCAQSKKFMPHFHVPLQSGSNKILKKMKRRYEREYYEDRVKRIKSNVPDACIGADVIVGFPGETEGDFFETYNFLNELNISYLHVFTYSVRSNTGAVEMGERVSKETKADRSKMLHILSDKKQRYFHDQFINKNRPVLFENIKNGKIIGHTDNYIKVQVEGGTSLINTIQPVMMKENHTSRVSGILD